MQLDTRSLTSGCGARAPVSSGHLAQPCSRRQQGRAVPPRQLLNERNDSFRHAALHQSAPSRRAAARGGVRTNAMFKGLFKSDEAGATRKRYQQRVDQIAKFEAKFQALDDAELKAQTPGLQDRARGGETMVSLLPEAFAVRPHFSTIGRVTACISL